MSTNDSDLPEDSDEVDLVAATDSATASSKEPKIKRQRRRKPFDEAISRNAQRVYDVRSSDIIFGRGKGYQDHPGNKKMRAIIRRHKEEYHSIHRSRKRDLVEAVYSEITRDGARFLHKPSEEDVFAVVDIPIALQKVRNTLRCKKSGMVPTEDDSEILASTSQSVEASLADANPKSPGARIAGGAASMQASLPFHMTNLGRHPLASQLGLIQPLAMLPGSQLDLGLLPSMSHGANPLSHGGLLGNDLLRQPQFAGLAAGLNMGLGGLQLPLAQQQRQQQQQGLQVGMHTLSGRTLAQGFPLMGSMPLLQGSGASALGPLPSSDAAASGEKNAPTKSENEKS